MSIFHSSVRLAASATTATATSSLTSSSSAHAVTTALRHSATFATAAAASTMSASTSTPRPRASSPSSSSSSLGSRRSSSPTNMAVDANAYSSSYATTASVGSSRGFASSSSPSSSSSSSYKPVLTTKTINPNVLKTEYAVRGELSNRANKYAQLIADGKAKQEGLPFDSVVTANIGNPQQQPFLAQKPLTFWRQVAALTELPELMDTPGMDKVFPADVQERARLLLEDVGSVGAYSHSKGASVVRKHIAEFIEERDGYPADPELIYLTSGASGGVQLLMQVLIASRDTGIMIPIPQYPLYSATLALYDATPVEYDLNPFDDWSLDVEAMARSIDEARARGTDVRALVIINPGNPTGQCLLEQNIRDLVRMAHDKRIVLLADEVYQANIYQPETRPFVSFKKVVRDFSKSSDAAERRIADEVELVSFHSISKGVSGECGRRGGYFELVNIDAAVEAEVYKMASISLCPSLQGQIGVDMLVKPPREGEPSYDVYRRETEAIHATLLERSEKMAAKFDALPGVEVQPAQGALYLFPRVTLPPRAHDEARKRGKKVDEFYCLEMLDKTGICVVPGSGFGKMPERDTGACFFRTTVLAKETDSFIERYGKFHTEFLETYK